MDKKNNSSCLGFIIFLVIIAAIIYFVNNSGFFNSNSSPNSSKKKTNGYIDTCNGFFMDKSVHSYDSLSNDKQRKIYNQFEYCVGDITEEKEEEYYKTVSFELSGSDYNNSSRDDDVTTAYEAFYADNPQVFWLCGYGYENDKDKKINNIYIKSRYNSAKVSRMKENLNKDIARFYSSVPTDLKGYYLEKYVHDYLSKICEYNKEIASVRGDSESDDIRRNNPEIGTAYGAIHNGDAVCNGYAQAFELLCKCVGLDCVYIVGGTGSDTMSWAKSTLHAWNAVSLSDQWYLVDPTWDDNDDPNLHYLYFNVTTDQISEDHSSIGMRDGQIGLRGRENVFLPKCTALFYNYFSYDEDCVKVLNIENDSIGQELINKLNSGNKTINIYFDPNIIDYKNAKKKLFDNGNDNYMNRYLDYVTANSSFNYSNYTYWTLDSRNAVIIQLNY